MGAMRDSSFAESQARAGDAMTPEPAAASEQATALLASMARRAAVIFAVNSVLVRITGQSERSVVIMLYPMIANTIVSGLALGIDAAAHAGALKNATDPDNGSSIAVIGTGIDLVYPARHRALAHKIAEEACLVSEYPLGTPAIASNFPRRNRLISGLASGVLVVEAAAQSGSLITARSALEQGRDVFAIPGSIHSPLSKGCHQLIRQGAKLVECAEDVLQELPARRAAAGGPAPASAASWRYQRGNG